MEFGGGLHVLKNPKSRLLLLTVFGPDIEAAEIYIHEHISNHIEQVV